MPPVHTFIALDAALLGERVLWRHFLSTMQPREGWVREFSTDGRFVRLAKSDARNDAGLWHRVYELRIEAILAKPAAPSAAVPPDVAEFVDFPGGAE